MVKRKGRKSKRKSTNKTCDEVSCKDDSPSKRHSSFHPAREEESAANLNFEDPFEDEWDNEEMMVDEEDEKQQSVAEQPAQNQPDKLAFQAYKHKNVQFMDEDEQLDYDPSAYDLFHQMNVDWPCLSFDIIRDNLGSGKHRKIADAGHTIYLAAGSQADHARNNKVTVMKLQGLNRSHDSDSDDDHDDLDDEPTIDTREFAHNGSINRLRTLPQSPHMIAVWSDLGEVGIWNSQELLSSLEAESFNQSLPRTPSARKVHTWSGHPCEGFALDWSAVVAGTLATGDCQKYIYVWAAVEAGWEVDKLPFSAHLSSVEDLQWSPNQANVFVSCSVDKSIKVWNTTDHNGHTKAALSLDNAHDADINVISWNRNVEYLLVSGSDDGSVKIWDLRKFNSKDPLFAFYKFHTAPITSVEWHPTLPSVLATCGADEQICLWDFEVENDPDAKMTGDAITNADDFPPQLQFVHMGINDPKEVHWHPQIPGVLLSTAANGFNVFRACNMVPDENVGR